MTMALASLPAPRGAKAAIVLCAAGEPLAARLLARLAPDELRRLDELAGSLGSISSQDLAAIIDEFAGTMSSTVGLQSAAEGIAKLIQGSLSPKPAVDGAPAAGAPGTPSAKELLEALSRDDLIGLMSAEAAPVSTAVLSLLSSAAAAAALENMPAGMRLGLLRGLLTLKPMSDHCRGLLESAVRDALAKVEQRTSGKERQLRIASIVNRLDEQQVAEFVTDLETAHPESATAIRDLLFTFQDIGRLNAKSRATLLDKVSTEQMVVALQGCDVALRDLILSSLTARGRRMIEAELTSRAAAPATDIKIAKRSIADLALDMASRGEIALPSSTGEA